MSDRPRPRKAWLPAILRDDLWRWVVPNSLSFLRIGLALAFPWIPRTWRLGTYVLAALSDMFDGRLSRSLQGTSTFGQILDPVADKMFVAMVLMTLVADGVLTPGELVLIGFRDLAVLCGSGWAIARNGWRSLHHMPPSFPGKLATAGQFAFFLTLTPAIDHTGQISRVVEFTAAILSVVAGIDYLRREPPGTGGHETAEL